MKIENRIERIIHRINRVKKILCFKDNTVYLLLLDEIQPIETEYSTQRTTESYACLTLSNVAYA